MSRPFYFSLSTKYYSIIYIKPAKSSLSGFNQKLFGATYLNFAKVDFRKFYIHLKTPCLFIIQIYLHCFSISCFNIANIIHARFDTCTSDNCHFIYLISLKLSAWQICIPNSQHPKIHKQIPQYCRQLLFRQTATNVVIYNICGQQRRHHGKKSVIYLLINAESDSLRTINRKSTNKTHQKQDESGYIIAFHTIII